MINNINSSLLQLYCLHLLYELKGFIVVLFQIWKIFYQDETYDVKICHMYFDMFTPSSRIDYYVDKLC